MIAIVRRGTLVSLLLCSIACTNADRPTAPSTPPPAILTRPSGEWPPLGAPATIYHAVSGDPGTRYVLYENGVFSLQFYLLGGVEFVGVYRQEAEQITFFFTRDQRWFATGTLKGDVLEVRYSDIMVHSDFVNGTYQRSS